MILNNKLQICSGTSIYRAWVQFILASNSFQDTFSILRAVILFFCFDRSSLRHDAKIWVTEYILFLFPLSIFLTLTPLCKNWHYIFDLCKMRIFAHLVITNHLFQQIPRNAWEWEWDSIHLLDIDPCQSAERRHPHHLKQSKKFWPKTSGVLFFQPMSLQLTFWDYHLQKIYRNIDWYYTKSRNLLASVATDHRSVTSKKTSSTTGSSSAPKGLLN